MDLFDLAAKITLDTSEYERGLDEAGKKASGFGSKLKSGLATAAKAAGVAIVAAGAAVVSVTKQAVSAYADYEQLVGGVETLFKDSADVVQKYAANAYKTAGLSANEYMETVTSFSASLLQSLGGDTAAAADYADMAISDMSDNANKMGTDMGLIQNAYQGFAKQNYTMLDNLKLGYGGTQTEMERLITDAEALDSSFTAARDTNGDLAMSYADIVDAIHIVQDNMGITGTTAKEASTTISGSIGMMKASWKDLLVGLASGSADIDSLINNVVTSAETAFSNLMPAIENTLTGIGSVVEKIAPIIADRLPGVVTNVLPSLISAATSMIEGIVNALPTLISVLAEQAPFIIETIITALVANIPALVEAAGQLVAGIVTGLINAIPALIEGVIALGKALLDTFLGWFGIHSPSTVMQEAGTNIVQGLINGIVEMWSNLLSIVGDLLSGLGKVFSKAWDGIKTAASNAWNSVKDTATKVWTGIKTGVSNIAKNLGTALSNTWGTIKQKASSAWESVKSTATTAWNGLKTGVSNIASALGDTLSNKWNSLKNTASNVWDAMKSGASSAWSGISSTAGTMWENIKSGISDKITAAKEKVGTMINAIKNFFHFDWSLPKLKLPHLSITGSFSLIPPSVPHFSIEWYKKAMDNAMLLNGATIFGASGNTLLGGGEAGPEVVAGADTLMRMIKEASGGTNNVTINVYASPNHDEKKIAAEVERVLSATINRRRAGALA